MRVCVPGAVSHAVNPQQVAVRLSTPQRKLIVVGSCRLVSLVVRRLVVAEDGFIVFKPWRGKETFAALACVALNE